MGWIPTVGALSCTIVSHFSYNPKLALHYNFCRTSVKTLIFQRTPLRWGENLSCGESPEPVGRV